MALFMSLFGYCMTLLSLPVVLILLLIQNLFNNQKLFDPLIKGICRLIPLFFGIRIRTVGREALDPEKTYVFIANHVNIFDPLILYGYIPHFLRGVELEDHFSWPVWGSVIRRLGNIPISHKNTRAALESLDKAAVVMSKGTSIGILPEGHRTRNGRLQPFMGGAFRLTRSAGVDMIPIAMKGLWERKTVHSLLVKPGRVEMVFGKPISSEDFKDSTDRSLRNRAWREMKELLG